MAARRRFDFARTFKSDPDSCERPDINIPLGIKNIREWRESRCHKVLWELQAEVCELAAIEVASLETLSEASRARILGKINDNRLRLCTTQNAIFVPTSVDSMSVFSKAKSDEIRNQFGGLLNRLCDWCYLHM